MLTRRQYLILNSCADDWEVFYILFAEVNYGGQVFPREKGPGYAKYADEEAWTIKVLAEDVVNDVMILVTSGLLECCHPRTGGGWEPAKPDARWETEFAVYRGYTCLTFEDHVKQFGYGPHRFRVSEAGHREIRSAAYRSYDAELGWE
jgi:hypothetical protein